MHFKGTNQNIKSYSNLHQLFPYLYWYLCGSPRKLVALKDLESRKYVVSIPNLTRVPNELRMGHGVMLTLLMVVVEAGGHTLTVCEGWPGAAPGHIKGL